MKKTVFFHPGFTKAGSTSFQHSLGENEEQLNDNGFQIYHALTKNSASVANELAHCIVRPGVLGSNLSQNERTQLKSHLYNQLVNTKFEKIIVSGEIFSYMRKEAELMELIKLFSFPNILIDWKIIIVKRDPENWYKSHSFQMQKKKRGRLKIFDPRFRGSFLAKKWLVDHDGFIKLFKDQFDDVTVLRFEDGPVDQALYNAISTSLPLFDEVRENIGNY